MKNKLADEIQKSQKIIDGLFDHFDVDEKALSKKDFKKHDQEIDVLFQKHHEMHGPVFIADLYELLYKGAAIAQEMTSLMAAMESMPEIKVNGGFKEVKELIKSYADDLGFEINTPSAETCDCPKHRAMRAGVMNAVREIVPSKEKMH